MTAFPSAVRWFQVQILPTKTITDMNTNFNCFIHGDAFVSRAVRARLRLLRIFFIAVLFLSVDLAVLQAATITVNTTNDEWNTGGLCSIREALDAVRVWSNTRGCVGTGTWGINDTINVPAGLYTLTGGDLEVGVNVTINGAGGNDNGTRVNGNNISRVFQVISGVTASFNDLQIENGLSGDNFAGGGVDVADAGADLTLNRCAVVSNEGTGDAAGGLGTSGGGTLHLNSCLVTGNSNASSIVGAGIDNNDGTITVNNSTISGNAGSGPGFYNFGNTTSAVTFSTFNNNTGNDFDGDSAATFSNTILNSGCVRTVIDNEYNTDSGTGCGLGGTSQSNTSVPLQPLDLNGGSTLNHAIDNTTVSAYDRIPNGTNGCGTTVTHDQRGAGVVSRPASSGGNFCDIGAFEYDPSFTQVIITSFRGYMTEEGSFLEWQTGSEIGTAGFYILRSAGKKNGKKNKFITISKELIPSVGEPQGGVYVFHDTTAIAGKTYRYKLLELEAGGRHHKYGPFEITFASAHERMTRQSTVPAASFSSSPARSGYSRKAHRAQKYELKKKHFTRRVGRKAHTHTFAPKGRRPALKLTIQETGLYYLSSEEIAEATGLSLSRTQRLIAKTRFRLTTEGKQVAWLAENNNTGLFFYGEGINSPYTEERVYWLKRGRGQRMERLTGDSPWQVPEDQTFVDHLILEEDILPFSSFADDMDSDYWYWHRLISGHSSMGNINIDMILNNIAENGEAILQLRVRGIPLNGFSDSHRLSVTINGNTIGEVRWNGENLTELSIPFSQDVLQNDANKVQITAIPASDGKTSYIVLDSMELQYHRYYQAEEGSRLTLRGDANESITISGFADNDILLLDISKHRFPKLVDNVHIIDNNRSEANSYSLSFVPADADTPYYALTPDAVLTPTWKAVSSFSNLKRRDMQVDYLLIAPEEFLDAAQELADIRDADGLQTAVISLENIYDNFNYGIASPRAIRDFIAHVYKKNHKQLRYVVLVGEGSIDYRNLQGYGDSIVPPWLAATEKGLFVSDISYGDMDGDSVPEVLVSRLPVDSVDELSAYVDKVLEHQVPQMENVLLLADNPDEAGDFTADSEQIKDMLPSAVLHQSIYLSDYSLTEARTRLFAAVQSGVGLVNYAGHGSVLNLAHEGLLRNTDVQNLENHGRYPIFLALTCVVNRYGLPGYDSLAEELVTGKDTGAVAFFGPSGLSLNNAATMLDQAIFRAIYGHGETILGEIILRAMREYGSTDVSPYLLSVYNLTGDPGIRLTVPALDRGLISVPLRGDLQENSTGSQQVLLQKKIKQDVRYMRRNSNIRSSDR